MTNYSTSIPRQTEHKPAAWETAFWLLGYFGPVIAFWIALGLVWQIERAARWWRALP